MSMIVFFCEKCCKPIFFMILKVRFLRGEGMINFDYTLLLQFANLLVLLILLNFLLFKPVLRALDMREGRISSAHNKADTLRQEAAELAETYEETNTFKTQLEEALVEVYEIIVPQE